MHQNTQSFVPQISSEASGVVGDSGGVLHRGPSAHGVVGKGDAGRVALEDTDGLADGVLGHGHRVRALLVLDQDIADCVVNKGRRRAGLGLAG